MACPLTVGGFDGVGISPFSTTTPLLFDARGDDNGGNGMFFLEELRQQTGGQCILLTNVSCRAKS